MYTTSFETVELGELLVRAQTYKHQGIRFVQLCAEKLKDDSIDLLYTFYDETRDAALNLVVPLAEDSEVPSIQELYFASFSYENEAHDLYGVTFKNMVLDFGGHFFNVADTAPMTIISPEEKARRDKEAKLAAAKAAKAAKEAKAKAEAAAAELRAAEDKQADAALTQTPAEADAAAVAKVNELAPKAAAEAAPAAPAIPASVLEGLDERTAKMVAKLATMPADKAAKLRENLAAKGIVVPEIPSATEKEAE